MKLWPVVALLATASGCAPDEGPLRFPPVVVMSDVHVPGVLVRGVALGWRTLASPPLRYEDPVPVRMTMSCLQGTTRRGRYVRQGIVAADPRFFTLSRYVELYVGRKYLGRFLVDDTGLRIRGPRIDVWTPSCREARRFGVQSGTAVLVPGSRIDVQQAGAEAMR